MTASGADLLRRHKRTMRVEKIQLCLRPDLVEKHIELNEELAGMAIRSGERLANAATTEAKALAQRIKALESEIEDASAWFEFQQMGRDRWQELVDNNPAREGNVIDAYTGFNRDGVLDDAVRVSLISPVFEDCDGTRANEETGQPEACPHDDCGTYQQWSKQTPASEWQAVRDVVNVVNSGVVENPKSELASRILGTPGDASEQPAATG